MEPSAALARLQEQLAAAAEDYARARRAEIIAAGGAPAHDDDPLSYVRGIADLYAARGTDPERITAVLDSLTEQLDLADVRALRVAAEAAAEITPRLIHLAAEAHGMKAPTIAAELGVTESYVYRILRNRP